MVSVCSLKKLWHVMMQYNNKTYLFSQRFALKSRWIAWSSSCDLLVRYDEIICPTPVFLSGNRNDSAGYPSPSKYLSSLVDCEVFPLRSKPSRTINAPLELQFCLFSMWICLKEQFNGNFEFKWNLNDSWAATLPKLLEEQKKK